MANLHMFFRRKNKDRLTVCNEFHRNHPIDKKIIEVLRF